MRPAKIPKSKLGKFLYNHLESRGISQSELARKLGVSDPTISRVMHSQTKRLKTITEEEFCHAAELTGMAQREFLALSAQARLMFSSGIPAAPLPLATPAPVYRYRSIDLDIVDSTLNAWASSLSRNQDPLEVLKGLAPVNERLRELQEKALTSRIADLRITSVMLIAAVKEAVLPWRTQRPSAVIQVYNDLDQLFAEDRHKLPKGFERLQARMMLRRAVLYREKDDIERCLAELDLIKSFDLDRAEDYALQVALATQSLHTTTTFMEPTERVISEWRKAADKIRARIDAFGIGTAETKQLHAVVDYTMGVGWKRFMWRLRIRDPQLRTPSRLIEEYAREARNWLDALRLRPNGVSAVRTINMYHDSISDTLAAPELEASAIDALVWCDPEEALYRVDILRTGAETRFPTVLAKLDESTRLANWRLGRASREEALRVVHA